MTRDVLAAAFLVLAIHVSCPRPQVQLPPPPATTTTTSIPVPPPILHVDPASVSREQLLAIRGAMWTAHLEQLPPKNLIAFSFYPFYGPLDRARMVNNYKARGYTHVVSGPIAGTDCYHNLWPCHDASYLAWMPVDDVPGQAQFDAYLDALQELWDGGLIPICFVKPDGWETRLERLDQLDALYRQPRAQALCRVVVYEGWEPSGEKYGWANRTYVQLAQRGADVFPNAIRLLHTAADLDAPTGLNDDQLGMTNGKAWRNIAPYIHGWLAQYGGYAHPGGTCGPTEQFKHDFEEAIRDNIARFHTQRNLNGAPVDWPSSSAFGDGIPLKFYAGEYAAYVAFWEGCPEAESQELGAIAMHAGADGFLDGGPIH